MRPNLNRQVCPSDVLLLHSEPTLRGTDHVLFLFLFVFFFFVCCSSPHLMEVRERIRINGKPLAKDKFAKYFFDCWDNLHNNGDVSGQKLLSTVHIIIQAQGHTFILSFIIGGVLSCALLWNLLLESSPLNTGNPLFLVHIISWNLHILFCTHDCLSTG